MQFLQSSTIQAFVKQAPTNCLIYTSTLLFATLLHTYFSSLYFLIIHILFNL